MDDPDAVVGSSPSTPTVTEETAADPYGRARATMKKRLLNRLKSGVMLEQV